MRLQGKTAFITGAGMGQGREAALLFAREGARVIVADIDRKAGEETVRRIQRRGGKALFTEGDVSVERDVVRMLETGVKRFRGLHILYNNAAVLWEDRDRSALEISEPNWDRVLAVNLKGPLLVAKHGSPHLIRSGGGSIINVGGVAALRGSKLVQDADISAKGGLVSLTKSLALQLARHNVRCNILQPGFVDPDSQSSDPKDLERRKTLEGKIPLGRVAHPREIASVALFLASEDSSYITGAEIIVDGGFCAG
ncbi:MAG TPA: SDR family NAD(P)-dependent oxidoreductase [Candidatus Acidoferrum sp.]|nr:SDR family NAD(P)-dependent oxidoreductase [Candidatus Acidoferrum sp.]